MSKKLFLLPFAFVVAFTFTFLVFWVCWFFIIGAGVLIFNLFFNANLTWFNVGVWSASVNLFFCVLGLIEAIYRGKLS